MPTDTPSRAFDLLHPDVRRWIWRQGWEELRDIQERSIPVLLDGDRDLIVAAATASGKTEAAFLPIVSRLAADAEDGGSGIGALYVSPLRALINDQFRRMEGLCEDLGLPVFKWHGDVAQSVKQRARKARSGIILITPESLEAILVRRGFEAGTLFRGLRYVVVDELHAFLDEPRGRQLRSLLHRIERAAGRRVARVGLSATLADLSAAAAFLRPTDPAAVEIGESSAAPLQLKLQLRGHLVPPKPAPKPRRAQDEDDDQAPDDPAQAAIAAHLFETLRGSKNLVFAGSRRNVEAYSATLADLCEQAGVPGEFLAHHGSLSRDWREEAETRMRDPGLPGTIVCTTTLELGIDVGSIAAVAQIGPGHSVAGMRQRLGRSGRRAGQPAVMRVYAAEEEIDRRTHPLDALRLTTVCCVAMIELMLARWMEPPRKGALDLSTALHQILALIRQHGGASPGRLFEDLVRSKVFDLPLDLFGRLLRRMGDPEVGLLEQAPDGTMLLGPEGERITEGYDFFSVFKTAEEYRLVHRGRTLGSLPIEYAPAPGQFLIFAGRRWLVEEIEPQRREILVRRSRGGNPPVFGGEGAAPHEGVVGRMRELYVSGGTPRYLDRQAAALLEEGRETFRRLEIADTPILRHGGDLLLFPWSGGPRQAALALALTRQGLKASVNGVAIVVDQADEADLAAALRHIADKPAVDAVELAALVPDKLIDKFDRYLDDGLLTLNYASRMLDASDLAPLARRLLAGDAGAA